MFVAWRELRFARGRFLLITAVIAMLSVLVGFLSGLSGGLAFQNISAVLALPADQVVLGPSAPDAKATYSDSTVTAAQAQAWADFDGVQNVVPLGISQARALSGDQREAVTLFGADQALGEDVTPTDGKVVIAAPAAEALGVQAGDVVTIAGQEFTVAALADDAWYSHTPVVYLTLDDWRTTMAAMGSQDAYATALLVTGDADWAAADDQAGTQSTSTLGSLSLLPAFRSEIGSLLMIVAMLFGISALVTGAFFTVWTIQRRSDLAVLKALGADQGALRRDALGQAIVLLLLGTGVGTAIVAAAGLALQGALPFLLSPLTTLVPALLMIGLGLLGAALALRPIASAEPLTALGSNR